MRVYCPRCRSESPALVQRLVCSTCGEWRTEVVAGDELVLMSVDLVAAEGMQPERGRQTCARTADAP